MKVILGLGNPGNQYRNSRHNAGIMLVDKLAEQKESEYGWRRKKDIFTYETEGWILAKTATFFMNDSGRVALEFKQLTQGAGRDPSASLRMTTGLIIAHDDLDLKLGEYKIQFARGPKVHHGIESVEKALKTDKFWRIRIGIDNRDANARIPGEQYVLQPFSQEEKQKLDDTLEKIRKELAL